MEEEKIHKRCWNQGLSIGVALIDKQHEVLCNIYDHLKEISQFKGQQADIEMHATLNHLESFLDSYSNELNEQFKDLNDSEYKSYQVDYELFVRKMEEFILFYKSRNPLLIYNILNFLKKWLVHSIGRSQTIFVRKEIYQAR